MGRANMSDTDPKYDYPSTNDKDLEQCVLCGSVFGQEGSDSVSTGMYLLFGPVVDVDTGNEHPTVGESEPGAYLAHPDCYKWHYAQEQSKKHHTLDEFC